MCREIGEVVNSCVCKEGGKFVNIVVSVVSFFKRVYVGREGMVIKRRVC